MKVNLNELLVSADKVATIKVADRLISARRISINGIPMVRADVELAIGDEIQIGNNPAFPFTETMAEKLEKKV